ncbi:tumor necrosis factor receptor superfamily member 11A isoform X2 [Betta splendens]|uniref:Tumor necrosis factor receptor superfamily member 11A isoform X2 n=1 Tax=Betta splendens TaxID=158456 RepID=A0A6P7MDL0_BETSP|nr:tumor necrosis factor receptor superfamily member 11A isoform X2 [Betta splendens]
MRLSLTTSWIFRGWITCFLLTFYAQDAASRSLQCDDRHYLKNNRCCEKCRPGFHVHRHCNESQQTRCLSCGRGEYQPDWTESAHCHQQKFCDSVKGFMERVDNRLAEEPCRCQPHLQCSPINCEYCEQIPACGAGYGLDVDPESSTRRKTCVPCKKGFFSHAGDQCKQWTNCKAEGRSETQPGSAQADAQCGPHVSVPTPSWVIVSVLSVITVLCLLILLLFCFKDKLKLLSVNLRSCVQNLKRTRIQQETLTPLYQSGGARSPCETTKLTYQASHGSSDEPPCPPGPASDPEVQFSLPVTETQDTEAQSKALMVDQRSGEPVEVSDDEDGGGASPLLEGSCVCVGPFCEPLEVGENEDCSQAVSHGTAGACSCGGLDGERGDEGLKSETAAASLASASPPLGHASSEAPPSSLPEHCLPLSQAQTTPEARPHPAEPQSLVKRGRPASADSSVTPCVSPSTSSSAGDLYLDKPAHASAPEGGRGLLWEDKLSSGESELQCSPESLHSQLAEPTLTSGQVSGNHNTTFISSGQVMNFSGDVVVVYVSQTSVGGDGAAAGDTFGSPVQEEASETAPFFQSSLRSQGNPGPRSALQDETLPVQEVMEKRPVRK